MHAQIRNQAALPSGNFLLRERAVKAAAHDCVNENPQAYRQLQDFKGAN